MTIRAYIELDVPAMAEIWNEVVEEGNAFPQNEKLDNLNSSAFFAGQSYTAVAVEEGELAGLYILHPNNVGRVGHIANASYAVKRKLRAKGIGKALVEDSLKQLSRFGFRILQFNAVVASNTRALALYERLGFERLGTIKGGFAMNDGSFVDIVSMVYYATGS
ncbi:MAG: GNAT family N-acetyltransferase [Spirochaetia bacterium]|nr:GNAT family N-acetyltransferase [Spirochaetia bacterium]